MNTQEISEYIIKELDKAGDDGLDRQSIIKLIRERLISSEIEDFNSIENEDEKLAKLGQIYIEIRQYILTNTEIRAKRGYYGGFRKINTPPENIPEENENEKITEAAETIYEDNINVNQESQTREKSKEKALYDPIEKWAKENQFDNCRTIGGLLPFGKWSNPDLLDIRIINYKHLIGFGIEISSFEVKLDLAIDSVYQAKNYENFSHFIYLVVAKTEIFLRSRRSEILDLATRNGIGLICLKEDPTPENPPSFQMIHESSLMKPSMEMVDALLDAYSNDSKFEEVFKQIKNFRPILISDVLKIN